MPTSAPLNADQDRVPESVRIPTRTAVIALGAGVLLILLLRSAWASDDAFIGYRVIDNFLAGHGLRWNIDERVQVFTFPLFLFLGIVATFLTGNAYLAVLFLSLALTMATFLVIVRDVPTSGVVMGTAILVFSKAFVDFSVSGMENPVTGLLAAMFVYAYWRGRGVVSLSFIAALAALNRLDTMLLFVPALAVRYLAEVGQGGARRWRPAILAWLPLFLWEAFSLFYFGFLFPNTAYAKLHAGVPGRDLILQGILYFVNGLAHDTLTMVVIFLGLALAMAAREWYLAAGVALYLIYIVWIGGDFMSGRYFTVPLTMALMFVLRYWRPEPLAAGISVVVVAAIGMSIPTPTVLTANADFHLNQTVDATGIADERAAYYPTSGLLRYHRDMTWPDIPSAQTARDLRPKHPRSVTWMQIGSFGWNIGPETHVIDPFGLGDALLARLPASRAGTLRIGHFARVIPPGYEKTVETGVNQIADPKISEYYHHLHVVISGDLWSLNRLREIVFFQLGYYDGLLPRYG